MRTLLDRKNFSSRTNGQVAAHRVTGLIIKRLWFTVAEPRCGSRDADFAHVTRVGRTCYAFSARPLTRRAARDVCARRGGSLLETPTASELRVAADYMRSASLKHLWTGGRRVYTDWQWADGQPLGRWQRVWPIIEITICQFIIVF